MNHSEFVSGYKSGAVKARVDKRASGFLYQSPSPIPRKYRVLQALIRTVFFGGTLVGIALFFFVEWYIAAVVLVVGLWVSTTSQKAAAKGVLATALVDESFYQMVVEKRVLIIEGDDSTVASSKAADDPSQDDARKASQKSYDIAADFGDMFEKNDGLSIYDVSQLPHRKEDIRDALFDIYRNDPDHDRQELIKAAVFELTNYQEGVGKDPVRGVPDLSQIGDDEDPTKLAEEILEKSEESSPDRYAALRKVADQEYADYKKQLGI